MTKTITTNEPNSLGSTFGASEGQLVIRHVTDLRLHPAYERHGIRVSASEFSRIAGLNELALKEPLLITKEGSIIDGVARWQLARSRQVPTVTCVEYELSEVDALRWLLHLHGRTHAMNDFTRIVLALELEPPFREQAKLNQRRGRQNGGSSKLTEAGVIDVRAEVATAAGVSAGNITKVKQLLRQAIPEVVVALRGGEVSIHRAHSWLGPAEEQRGRLVLYRNRQAIDRKVNQLLKAHAPSTARSLDGLSLRQLGLALEGLNRDQSTSVAIDTILLSEPVLLISTGLYRTLESQGKLFPCA